MKTCETLEISNLKMEAVQSSEKLVFNHHFTWRRTPPSQKTTRNIKLYEVAFIHQ